MIGIIREVYSRVVMARRNIFDQSYVHYFARSFYLDCLSYYLHGD